MNDGIERCSLKNYKDNMSMEGMDHTAQLMMQQILVDKEGSDIDRTAMVNLIELITAEARKQMKNLNGWSPYWNGAAGVFSLLAGLHAVPSYNKIKWVSIGGRYGVTNGTPTPHLMEISGRSSQVFRSISEATSYGSKFMEPQIQATQIESKAKQDRMETFKNEVMGNKKRKEDDKDRLVSMLDQERGNKGSTIREVTRS